MAAHDKDDSAEHLVTVDAGSELTAVTAASLRVTVNAAVDGSRASDTSVPVVRVILRNVTRFDIYGLGLLLGMHRQARVVGVPLIYTEPSSVLYTALRRHGLHRVLTIEIDLRHAEDSSVQGTGSQGGRGAQ
jgi:anti-anti-sigma regulatory factor